MYQHLLVAIDGSELSLQAGARAIELAKLCNARLTAVMACPTFRQLKDKGYFPPTLEVDSAQWEHESAEQARAILARFEAQAHSDGVLCATALVMDHRPWHTIVETANTNGCDVIVMGSHGYGRITQWLLGSQTTGVLSHTKIPVLVCR